MVECDPRLCVTEAVLTFPVVSEEKEKDLPSSMGNSSPVLPYT